MNTARFGMAGGPRSRICDVGVAAADPSQQRFIQAARAHTCPILCVHSNGQERTLPSKDVVVCFEHLWCQWLRMNAANVQNRRATS